VLDVVIGMLLAVAALAATSRVHRERSRSGDNSRVVHSPSTV